MKKTNKILSLVISVFLLTSATPVCTYANADINTGDYVQMGTYNGTPILWRCITTDDNGPLLLSDEILSLKAFDASGDADTGSHARGDSGYRNIAGSNYWADSNIRSWLNSDELAGKVSWKCGNSPIDDELTRFHNSYSEEAGFLTGFTLDERKLISSVSQKSILDGKEYADMSSYGTEAFKYDISINNIMQNYTTAYSETVTDKIFLLDVAQLSSLVSNLGSDYAKGYVSESAIAYTDSFKENGLATGAAWGWWLRTPVTEDVCHSTYVRYVMDNGTEAGLDYAKQTHLGIRPAFYLNSSDAVMVSGIGTKDEPYKFRPTPDTISDFGVTVSKYSGNIINVSGNAGAEHAGKNVNIILIPKDSYTMLVTAKHITNATVAENGSYNAKFKAEISENDVLIVKINGADVMYTLASPKDASEKLVELEVYFDSDNKVNVNLNNKYVDATSAKLIIASYDAEGRLIKSDITDYALAFGENGETQSYFSDAVAEGAKIKVFMWNNFAEMIPLSGNEIKTVPDAEETAE